jgi:hypothetical protein
MTIALSDPSKGLDPRRAPINLQRLFAPLIETHFDRNDPENPLCCLCHATVYEFFTTTPNILYNNSGDTAIGELSINKKHFADVCLRYLGQEKYSISKFNFSNLLQDRPLAVSSSLQKQVQNEWLLTYCAKYWDKHLDSLTPSPELFRKVIDFLESPNFQTLLWIQSISVAGQFRQYVMTANIPKDDGVEKKKVGFFRRALPRWFLENIEDNSGFVYDDTHRRDYRHFVHEWGHLLELGTCDHPEGRNVCPIPHQVAEIDQCLTGILGPTHFMRNMVERHPSFMLKRDSFQYEQEMTVFLAESLITNDTFSLITTRQVILTTAFVNFPNEYFF